MVALYDIGHLSFVICSEPFRQGVRPLLSNNRPGYPEGMWNPSLTTNDE